VKPIKLGTYISKTKVGGSVPRAINIKFNLFLIVVLSGSCLLENLTSRKASPDKGFLVFFCNICTNGIPCLVKGDLALSPLPFWKDFPYLFSCAFSMSIFVQNSYVLVSFPILVLLLCDYYSRTPKESLYSRTYLFGLYVISFSCLAFGEGNKDISSYLHHLGSFPPELLSTASFLACPFGFLLVSQNIF